MVLPTLTVAAFQVSHLSPLGIVKSNTALVEVQLLTTQALLQGSQVQVVQTSIVPVSPLSHLSPLGHFILLPSGFNITTPYFVGSS